MASDGTLEALITLICVDRSFLLKILKQSEYEEKINQLRRSEFTTFRNTNEARRSVMRILCFEARIAKSQLPGFDSCRRIEYKLYLICLHEQQLK